MEESEVTRKIQHGSIGWHPTIVVAAATSKVALWKLESRRQCKTVIT